MVRERLTYANIIATGALFVALGGSSYAALTLPRDSVGTKQIRRHAVAKSDLRRGAVTTDKVKNSSLRVVDFAPETRSALTGPRGPEGPRGLAATTFRATIDSAGTPVAGNAVGSSFEPPNRSLISFPGALTGCVATATLTRGGGPNPDPGPGRVIATVESSRVVVETFRADATPAPLPFNLIVAC
jgi:hypothetical protein